MISSLTSWIAASLHALSQVDAGRADSALVAGVSDAHDQEDEAHGQVDAEAYEQQQLDDGIQGPHRALAGRRPRAG